MLAKQQGMTNVTYADGFLLFFKAKPAFAPFFHCKMLPVIGSPKMSFVLILHEVSTNYLTTHFTNCRLVPTEIFNQYVPPGKFAATGC